MQMFPTTLLHQPKTLPVLLLLKHLSECQWKDVAFVLQPLSGERLNLLRLKISYLGETSECRVRLSVSISVFCGHL